MLTMTLTRSETSPEGTFGHLESEALHMFSGELPWHQNAKNVSCIPPGSYLCKPHLSPKHGKCFWVQAVPFRTEILIHAANWMGDVEEGFKSQLAGCIAIGMKFQRDVGANDQDMIQHSKLAVEKLIEYTEDQDFVLKVVSHTGEDMTDWP